MKETIVRTFLTKSIKRKQEVKMARELAKQVRNKKKKSKPLTKEQLSTKLEKDAKNKLPKIILTSKELYDIRKKDKENNIINITEEKE
jgi:hypothetical protein